MPEGSKFYIQGGLILDTADAQAERTGGVVIAGGTDVEVHVAAVAAMDCTAPVIAPAACEVERAIDIAPACRNKLQGRGERPGGVLVAPSVKFCHPFRFCRQSETSRTGVVELVRFSWPSVSQCPIGTDRHKPQRRSCWWPPGMRLISGSSRFARRDHCAISKLPEEQVYYWR